MVQSARCGRTFRQAPFPACGFQQIGPAAGRQLERTLAPPLGDLGVVTRHQHRRHGGRALGGVEHFGAAVVGAVEQAILEAVLLVGLGIAQHAGLQAGHAVEQRHRGQFPAGQDEIAQAQLQVDVAVDEALVDALVAAAQQDRPRAGRELAHDGLVDAAAGGGEVHDRRALGAGGAHGREAALQRLDEHHHAGAAAIGAVVDAAVVVVGELAQRPQVHVDLLRLVRAARHAQRQVRGEEVGEQRDDVETHRHSLKSRGPSRP